MLCQEETYLPTNGNVPSMYGREGPSQPVDMSSNMDYMEDWPQVLFNF